MNQVKVFKLISGEEVLAEVEKDESNFYTLKNPVGIAIVRGQNGQPNVGFAPFPLHSEQNAPSSKSNFTIDIPKQSVIYSYLPASDFLDNYNQIFGSGIVLPNKQLITG